MRIFLAFILLFTADLLSAQGGYLVTHYTRHEYKAGSQNWSIDTDRNGFVYSANNDGLLIYDGSYWKLFPNPGQTIMRAVSVAPDGKIYTGSYEEFGYWQTDSLHELRYHSLSSQLHDFNFHNDEIWKIVRSGNKVYFQSFSALFEYDGRNVRHIRLPGTIVFLLLAGEKLFVQTVTGDLYELKGRELQMIETGNTLKGTEVKSILPYSDGQYLVGTSSQGVFLFNGRTLVPWKVPANEQLRKYQINNGLISGNRIIFGTIVKGIFVLDFDGNILNHIHNENGLQDNTVLSLTADAAGNIWAGLDKGIDYITFNNPLEIYRESGGQIGSVYTAALDGKTLYLGTNQGIYTYDTDTAAGRFHYSGFLNNSQGQVWELKKIGSDLFCGHTTGTFLIKNGVLARISSISGGYSLKPFFHNESEYLLQSTYSSLVIYKKEAGEWAYKSQVKGFMEPSRFMEADAPGNIWIGHAVKGLYRLTLSESLDSVVQTRSFGKKDGLPSDFNIGVFRVGNRVVFTTGQQIFTWDDLQGRIIPFTELNRQLNGFETAERIVQVDPYRYFLIRKDDIALFSIRDNKVNMLYRLLLPIFRINLVDHYENIVQLDRQKHLVCLDDGFAILSTNGISGAAKENMQLVFRDIFSLDLNGEKRRIDPNRKNFTLQHSWNSLSISFTYLNHRCVTRMYQYRLENLETDWSKWTSDPTVVYTRLPKGNYTFSVRTISATGQVSSPISFSFRVKPAWYASLPAYLLYGMVLAAGILLSQYIFRRRVVRQHLRLRLEAETRAQIEKQQAEHAIMQLQNEKLQSEISHKTIELANSTMAIIRKNELLTEINTELDRQQKVLGNNYPSRYFEKLRALINDNISGDHDWKIFEELFDQAHADFFKRLKFAYPDLTQSDLKLCAYLKLNLSSKEIAQLLNISFRGVETRRYRLRKRLSLISDANLVEFIMQF